MWNPAKDVAKRGQSLLLCVSEWGFLSCNFVFYKCYWMCQDTRFFLGFPVSCKLSPTAVRLGLGSGSGSLLLRESYPLTSFISAALISFHSFFLNHLSGFVIVIICSPHVLLSLGFSFVLGNLRCPPPRN